MKNVHILPTDKPSRLHFTEFFEELVFTPKYEKLDGVNIYITSSNTDINENDYVITKDDRLVQVSYLLSKDLEGASKVILTTDQDLIKDGVQKIDDEFLEWFCKNPSCEEVFLTNDFEQVNQDNPILRGSTNVVHKYKIIIPKEELKQKQRLEKYSERFNNKENELVQGIFNSENWGKRLVNDVPKQETLEEVTERYSANELSQLGFINGAKWQEQQTIEEVFEWLTTNNYLTDLKETLIENFKNK